MKTERTVSEIVNLLLATLFAVPIAFFLEQVVNSDWYWFSKTLCCAPLLLCYIAARFSERRWGGASGLMAALSVIAALALEFLLLGGLDGMTKRELILLGATILPAILLYVVGVASSISFPPKFAVASTVMYLIEIFYLCMSNEVHDFLPPLAGLALANLIMSLYSFNSSSLYRGVHKVQRGHVKVPYGLRGKNILLLTIFIVVSVLIGLIQPFQIFFGVIVKWLINAIGGFIAFITQSGGQQPTGGAEEKQEAAEQIILDNFAEGPAYLSWIVYALVGGAILLVLILTVYYIVAFSKGGKGKRRIALDGFFKRFFARRRREEESYDDAVESLGSVKDYLKERLDAARAALQKLTRRPQRIDDMPDNRTRVRFAYKALLSSPRGKKTDALHRTPLELSAVLPEGALEALARDYNAARYSGAEVPEAAAVNAKASLSRMSADERGRGARRSV